MSRLTFEAGLGISPPVSLPGRCPLIINEQFSKNSPVWLVAVGLAEEFFIVSEIGRAKLDRGI